MSVPNAIQKSKLARYKPGAAPPNQVSTSTPTITTQPGSPNPVLIPYTSSAFRLLGTGNITAGGGSNGAGNVDVSLTGYAIPEGPYDDKTMYPSVNRPPHTCVVDQVIEGEHDGQTIDIQMVCVSTTMMRVWWNNMDGLGWYTEADSVWAARASLNSITPITARIDFGSRGQRQVRIELTGCYINGVKIEATAGWRHPSWPAGPHIIVVGDSISYGTFSDPSGLFSSTVKTLTIGGYIREMAARLGWHDIVNKSSGGTGYLSPGLAANAVQFIDVFGTPSQGAANFTVYDSAGAAHLAGVVNYNTTPSQLQTLCDSVYGAGNSLVGGASSFPGTMTITMQGTYAGVAVKIPQLATTTAFTGGGAACGMQQPGGQQYAFTDSGRLADALQSADSNTIVIWAGGYNDQSNGYTGSQIAAAMQTCIQATVAVGALPFVFGCFSSTAGVGQAAIEAINQTLKTAAQGAGALFADPTDPANPWYTPYAGTAGNSQSPNGAGNSDVYFGAPIPHPNRVGHQHYGAMAAGAIIRQFSHIF